MDEKICRAARPPIGAEEVRKAAETLKEYRRGKAQLEEMERQNFGATHQLLVQTQQDCEDIYLDAEEPEA